jgi:flavin reductase
MLVDPLPGAAASVPAVTRLEFRDAMAQLGAAVHIVTTNGSAGRVGFTATAICSVTDDPPSVLVCLNRGASAYAATVANGVLCINTLAADQRDLSGVFASKLPMDERFASGEWTLMESGGLALNGALLSMDCEITAATEVGTHDILICAVRAIRSGPGNAGLVYFKREYHGLGGA